MPLSLIRLLRWMQTHSSYPNSASTHSHLLSRLPLPRPTPPSSEDEQGRLHRLHLTLISSAPLLLPLLPRTVESIRSIILSLPDGHQKRRELIEELFKEILERFGDREEVIMRWWCEVREDLVVGIRRGNRTGGQAGILVLSRL